MRETVYRLYTHGHIPLQFIHSVIDVVSTGVCNLEVCKPFANQVDRLGVCLNGLSDLLSQIMGFKEFLLSLVFLHTCLKYIWVLLMLLPIWL